MRPTNLLIIMADQHSPKVLGSYGHPIVRTPHLDKLAGDGVRFTNAYSPSPLCVPARACFATGRGADQTGCWDNAHAYDGSVPGWGHRVQAAGHQNVSIGKLHYRQEVDPVGIDEQIVPMHIAEGKGDLLGAIRPDPPVRHQGRKFAEQVGPGETVYNRYDRDIAKHACEWLMRRAGEPATKPWVLFVSFIAPHFPLIVPQEYFDMYPVGDIPMPKPEDLRHFATHPWWKAFNDSIIIDQFFKDDDHRKIAIASYLGLCSFVDDFVGDILSTLEETGLAADTRVAYTSDHGENLGARGLWGKSTMHEESAGIPLILRGPDLPQGKVVKTPVSLLDFHPTILECIGAPASVDDADLTGESLLQIAAADDDPDRVVMSQYHGAASTSAAYMLRQGSYKYVHYVGFAPELFDLENDPEEMTNLADNEQYRSVLEDFEAKLRNILDPEEIDRRAKADQARLVDAHGGREAVLTRGGLHGTPAPGEKPDLASE
ncbi:MAG TPA: sulfatase-like hydrolase/transferase [Rhodospirillales bacterium]|jgi:choline-sulfatase|nr:sulfatase-like hydrolase/transferase [Rhodospirillales bacterium]